MGGSLQWEESEDEMDAREGVRGIDDDSLRWDAPGRDGLERGWQGLSRDQLGCLRKERS